MAAALRRGVHSLSSPLPPMMASRPSLTHCLVAVLHAQKAQLTRSFASTTRRSTATAAAHVTSHSAEPTNAKLAQSATGSPNEELHFDTLKDAISPDTLKAITIRPFKMTHMTPVQAAVLPLLPALAEPYTPKTLEEAATAPVRDLLVRAKTGTGKTLAFLVPIIEARLKAIEAWGKKAVRDAGLNSDRQLEARARRIFTRTHVGTLIISPTRELATQIANEALKLSYHHEFEVRLFVGGASKRVQMRDWMKGRRDIVVTTPGRMRDLLTSEPDIAKGLSHTQTLILDEADSLLDMGFRDDIDAIVDYLPKAPERQTFLFSATVSRAIQQIARATLDKRHIYINTVSSDVSPVHAHVPQYHTVLPSAAEQIPHILRLIAHDQLTNPSKSKAIVFLPTTKMTQLFATFLRELAKTVLPAGRQTRIYEIHSKRTQDARTATSDAFRKDNSGASVLVTSDVSARGVDYPNVSRVIQVGIPGSTEQYIHRVGRTGRAGTNGRGDLVLLPWEIGFVTWQLQQVPLKPITTNELKKQVAELADKLDTEPASAFASPKAAAKDKFGRPVGPVVIKGPVTPGLEAIQQEIQQLLSSIDEEAVNETFASLLGYYMAKSPELRVQKGVIVEGCKDWTVEACGLPQPPWVSEAFLAKLGFTDGRTKRFGAPRESTRSYSGGGSSWSGRGQQRLKGRSRDDHSLARDSVESRDPVPNPEEYRSSRYGKTPRRGMDESYEAPRRSFGDRDRDRSFGGRDDRERGGSRSFGRMDARGNGDAGESGYGMRRRSDSV